MAYTRREVHAPVLSGFPLLALAWLGERRVLGRPIARSFFARLGVDRFRERTFREPPSFNALAYAARAARGTPSASLEMPPPSLESEEQLGTAERPAESFAFPSVGDYARAYRAGELKPTTVADRIIHLLEHQDRGNPPLYAFTGWRAEMIRRQAIESERRIGEGSARSIFEGVPVALKDEIDLRNHATTLGTSFLSVTPAERDATVAARLREAGALLIGKANMHEIGIGMTGLNPFHGTPVNPYAPWRYPGGSSSGSASIVASGICPVAIGVDGGGSIRAPAAYCGVYGLMPTAGRVSSSGCAGLAPSVSSAGPIAGTSRDLALAYLAIAGPDPADPATALQPAPTLDGFTGPVEGLRIGVFQPWFEDAREEVYVAARRLLDELVERGARIVEIEITELDLLRVAHVITITTEIVAATERFQTDHAGDWGNETRATLALARHLKPSDYMDASRMRTRMMERVLPLFDQVDVIATPTTANLPPRLHRDRLLSGVSDLRSLMTTMRYTQLANMLGLPAVSVPAGFVTAHSRVFWHMTEERDEDGMIYSQVPVGLQFIGAHWQEALLLRLARATEEMTTRPRPRVYLSPFTANNPIEAGHSEPLNP